MNIIPNLPVPVSRILAVIGPHQDNNMKLAALLRKHRPDLADSFRSLLITPRFKVGELENVFRMTGINKLVIVCQLPEFPLLTLIDMVVRVGINSKDIICILEGEDDMTKNHLSTLGIVHTSIIDWESALTEFQVLER